MKQQNSDDKDPFHETESELEDELATEKSDCEDDVVANQRIDVKLQRARSRSTITMFPLDRNCTGAAAADGDQEEVKVESALRRTNGNSRNNLREDIDDVPSV